MSLDYLANLAAQQAGLANAAYCDAPKQEAILPRMLNEMSSISSNLALHLSCIDGAIRRLSPDAPPPPVQPISKEQAPAPADTIIYKINLINSKLRESTEYAQSLAAALEKIV